MTTKITSWYGYHDHIVIPSRFTNQKTDPNYKKWRETQEKKLSRKVGTLLDEIRWMRRTPQEKKELLKMYKNDIKVAKSRWKRFVEFGYGKSKSVTILVGEYKNEKTISKPSKSKKKTKKKSSKKKSKKKKSKKKSKKKKSKKKPKRKTKKK